LAGGGVRTAKKMTATQIQFRRGSAAQMATFTGAQGEVVVDTTNKRVVVHDGATAGGWPMAGLNVANTFTAAQTFAVATGPLVTLTSQSGVASPTPQSAGGVINPMLQIVGNNTQFVGIELDSFGSEGNTIVGMTMGGTAASPAATGTGAGMWNLNAGGYDGTAYSVSQASINMTATAAWTTSTHETKVMIQATPVGSTTKSLVATFQAGIQVGSPTGGDKGAGTLNAAGSVYSNGTALTCMGIEFLLDRRVTTKKWDGFAISGKHTLAHEFAAMIKAGFDPTDPEQYFDRMTSDRALPGMPSENTWRPGDHSLDELQMRSWLALELLAGAFATSHQSLCARLGALETQH
jgi:hypothetical protein